MGDQFASFEPVCLHKPNGELDQGFVCHIRVINRSDAGSPAPITVTVSHNDFNSDGSALKKLFGSFKDHLAAGSSLKLSPFPFESERSVPDSTEHNKLAIASIVQRKLRPPSMSTTYPRTLLRTGGVAELSLSPLPFDVRFRFARSGQDLWACSSLLTTASPYFRDLLDSGFAESQARSFTCSELAFQGADGSSADWSDSDEDAAPVTSLNKEHRIHSISVTDHSYLTYRAVWVWIVTQQIRFAPLSPSIGADAHSSVGTGAPQVEPLSKRHGTGRTLPSAEHLSAVSPKSVYRLTHKLQLESLPAQALAAFVSSLTVDNVARQLFSSTAHSYDAIRTAAAEFAVKHWDDVEKTCGMQQMRAKVEAGELDHGGVVSMALAQAALAKARQA